MRIVIALFHALLAEAAFADGNSAIALIGGPCCPDSFSAVGTEIGEVPLVSSIAQEYSLQSSLSAIQTFDAVASADSSLVIGVYGFPSGLALDAISEARHEFNANNMALVEFVSGQYAAAAEAISPEDFGLAQYIPVKEDFEGLLMSESCGNLSSSNDRRVAILVPDDNVIVESLTPIAEAFSVEVSQFSEVSDLNSASFDQRFDLVIDFLNPAEGIDSQSSITDDGRYLRVLPYAEYELIVAQPMGLASPRNEVFAAGPSSMDIGVLLSEVSLSFLSSSRTGPVAAPFQCLRFDASFSPIEEPSNPVCCQNGWVCCTGYLVQ